MLCRMAITGPSKAQARTSHAPQTTVPRSSVRRAPPSGPPRQALAVRARREDSQMAGLRRLSRSLASLSYSEAITALDSLQTNATTILLQRQGKIREANSLLEMTEFMHRLNLDVSRLNSLNFIHIAGTKGKGSTCAFIESILRAHGLKTGFFSSPHLLEARERIRINGDPLSEEQFAAYFQTCWEQFHASAPLAKHTPLFPAFFRFTNLMAFKVFTDLKVDVAILEVGIGGRYDSTNVISEPVVCGVSSLGFDHMDILGETLVEIASHKGGIFKRNAAAISVSQRDDAFRELTRCAREVNESLLVAPDFDSLVSTNGQPIHLGLQGEHQQQNAALAVSVAHTWLHRRFPHRHDPVPIVQKETKRLLPFLLPSETLQGLRGAKWPGRAQKLQRQNISYFLDGAHTQESMQVCARWFESIISRFDHKPANCNPFCFLTFLTHQAPGSEFWCSTVLDQETAGGFCILCLRSSLMRSFSRPIRLRRKTPRPCRSKTKQSG
eukprot:m.410670 g.410670  ORF g.410670 m.410670 type:complete len:497 (-) comp56539_c0_seq21:278-1768(-)